MCGIYNWNDLFEKKIFKKKYWKGLQLLIDSANQKYFDSLFVLGVIYHQVKYTKQDFHKAIKYYKDASTLNDQYSKNI